MNQPDYEAVWSTLPIPALVLENSTTICAMNPAAENFVGLSSKQVVGKSIEAYVGASSRVMDVVRQATERSVSVVQYEIEFSWKDKPLRIGTLQANQLGRQAGSLLLLFTPRGLAEKMDRSFASRSAARSVTGMAAMLAHEIRNPLAGISGAAQLLAMNLDDADKEMTELIISETDRIGDLVNRVEKFGDMRPMERKSVNIHDVIDRTVKLAKAGHASHVRFMEEYDPSLPPTIGDSQQLHQVFQNLFKNASEAVPPVGGVISVKTAFRPGVRLTIPGAAAASLPLEILISDNGKGIPEDLIKDIFDPFVTTKVNGSGLGLSLVSKVLTDHGGVIECDSEEGRTIFRVLLPISRPADVGSAS